MSGFYPFDKKHIVLYDKDDFVVALGYGSRPFTARATRSNRCNPRCLISEISFAVICFALFKTRSLKFHFAPYACIRHRI